MKTATNLQKSDTNNINNVIDYVFNQKLFDINTIMVCLFIQYTIVDNVKYGEVVQLINNVDSLGNPLKSPIQFNVPISYIMGGNAGINIEYQPNDIVIVAYNQRTLMNLKISWENGININNSIQPGNYGKFTLEDGIILGKISPTIPQIIINITNDGININSNNTPIIINSGTANTTINGQKVQVTATNEIDVTAPTIKLVGDVTCTASLIVNGINFATHNHSAGTYNIPSIGNVVGISGNPS